MIERPAHSPTAPSGDRDDGQDDSRDGRDNGQDDGRAGAREGGHGGRAPTPWQEARAIAGRTGRAGAAVRCGLDEALGQALAAPLEALTDLPAFDTSAMDGWAVSGPGPWQLAGQVLAGGRAGAPLAAGRAVAIATGAAVPPGTTAVLRREHGEVRPAGTLRVSPRCAEPAPGQDIRPRGQECRAGERLVEAGAVVTAAVLGLAGAAGYDVVPVVPRPRVDVFVLGDELLRAGLPREGRVRDALGPMLAPWLRELGARVGEPRRVADDAEALRQAVGRSTADLIVTTGGTAGGPVDFVRPVLARLKASLPVDGVAVRPGHPMVLAELPGGRPFVGLPGNPLAAVSGVVTLVAPLVAALSGRTPAVTRTARLTSDVSGHPSDTRLVPVAWRGRADAEPLRFHGPAMLRGFAEADALAVIPPGGVAAGEDAEVVMALPARWR
jgi:molybdopterin molybdotransferase